MEARNYDFVWYAKSYFEFKQKPKVILMIQSGLLVMIGSTVKKTQNHSSQLPTVMQCLQCKYDLLMCTFSVNISI